MAVHRQHSRRRLSTAAVFTIFCFVASLGSGVVGIVQDGEKTNSRHHNHHHHYDHHRPEEEYRAETTARQRLIGPGSFPPSCRFRCGRCSPCKAVHVPIQPGVTTPLDYYPEAWRCKCGDKFFMP